MTPADVEGCFTQSDGRYAFARWERPVVPVIFGVGDESLPVLKGAIEAIVSLAGHRMAETDPELGANFMIFFCRDWSELAAVPDLDRLVGGVGDLAGRLAAANAHQYRLFRFEETGAIRAVILFLRLEGAMADMPAETLALTQAAQAILHWSDKTFANRSPLAMANGTAVLRPEIGAIIRAAYDPVLPVAANDPSHALRLYARITRSL
ncbi:hypothetical protein FHY64_17765 [Pelagovum pacificum]|uniref:Uncharacterized protein n=1 Tax=Pelagovum pacificum TaxID=2588711 RepID=A0A5C5G8P6_9RHOB|nr:hypothetical protein FHY64_17765 [Pelagovum pacificum]